MTRNFALTFVVRFVWSALFLADTKAANLPKRPDKWFSSDEGRRTMDCILSWQSDHGDWPKNKDTTAKPYEGDR